MDHELFMTWEHIVTALPAETFCAQQIAEDLMCAPTTVNNRLRTLRGLGLVEFVQKDGKTLLFRRANK